MYELINIWIELNEVTSQFQLFLIIFLYLATAYYYNLACKILAINIENSGAILSGNFDRFLLRMSGY